MAPVFTLTLVALLSTLGTVPPASSRIDAQILAAFNQRLHEYVEIHRMAAAGLGDPILCADPDELSRQSLTLAALIREGRPGAREGDIFTAPVASAMRVRIAKALGAAKNAVAMPVTFDEETRLDVHLAIPGGAWHYTWAPMLRALPDLPPELEYQFVGRHLVLVDVNANLVVDVLRYAIPAPRPVKDVGPPDACDVHPDLPACWM
jgi:hypothetical protein